MKRYLMLLVGSAALLAVSPVASAADGSGQHKHKKHHAQKHHKHRHHKKHHHKHHA
ncbi:MAG: hypothetical protein QM755_13545 [Luteolibacter sp.]